MLLTFSRGLDASAVSSMPLRPREAALLLNFGPKVVIDTAGLLMSWRRRLEPAVTGRPSPGGLHAEICGVAPGGMRLGSHKGQSTDITLEPQGSNPHEFRLLGQVGQQSNLHPAALEFAALRPISCCTVPSCLLFLRLHVGTVPHCPVPVHGIAANFAAAASLLPVYRRLHEAPQCRRQVQVAKRMLTT
jgi:hypothetical protein